MRTAWSTLDRMHSVPARSEPVDSYLAALPPERRQEFERLRDFVREVLPAARETMGYRMPTYEGRARICAIAAQKRHFALYICELDVLERHRADFASLDLGKGCIRFKRFEDLPLVAARRLLRDASDAVE